ncbi:SAM-dependent methyltransferase [Actinoplanes sp. L3-i22]|uniref:SAM-dependent methyltransferase n=1 Tax=Actinoplanes sp. L3-i22 TaxID=2836373 RepID=UPI001C84A9B5|nr:SAM-dependent methyltransferase [Actinoplanes sp. L3-i22]
MSTDWLQWHDAYAGLAGRLTAVQNQIERHLTNTNPDSVRVISACAGDGRDLLGVLAGRKDAARVSALLVEYDATLAARAREAAEPLPSAIEVVRADAARSDVYAHAVPADLVLLCGIFGNISDADVRATIEAAPELCAPGAEVVWTRHRREPDLTPAIRDWFAGAGFDEVAFVAPENETWSVGVHRLATAPRPFEPGRHWFTFLR